MKIGFIGAGKVGFSLGRYFVEHDIPVSGYYSRTLASAQEASEFTKTGCYDHLEDLIRDSEVIILTVPDDATAVVWEQLKALQIKDRIVCHCSGVLSSKIFSDRESYGCLGYSIHPLLAVNDKLRSYQEFSNALFTIDGDEPKRQEMMDLLKSCGNKVVFMEPEYKVRYHAAAVFASNLVLGLAKTAMEELMACGFSADYNGREIEGDVPGIVAIPTTMIFVQSKDGLSHCEPEYSTPEHCTEGATVMLNAVLKADAE